jgi:predicted nucleic acid-binding Zn ribbon protein
MTNGGGSSGGGGSGSFGESLSLSGQVYTSDLDYSNLSSMNYVYTPYNGSDETFSSNVGGSGSIKGGKMSFSVGAPESSKLEAVNADEFYEGSSGGKVTPSDTRGIGLEFDNGLNKSYMSMNMSGSSSVDMVVYSYVDRDCTITVPGQSINEGDANVTMPNVELKLKKGWNAVNVQVKWSISGTSGGTSTVKMKTGDLSNCMWTLDFGGMGYIF